MFGGRDMNKQKKYVLYFITGFTILSMNTIAWSPVKRLTWSTPDSNYPDIAIGSGDKIHVVWDEGGANTREIFYKSSTDSGATWSGKKRLTWNSGNSQRPAAAADSLNQIHVVWDDYTPGNQEIFYKRSTDGGLNWSPLTRLTWSSDASRHPDIAIDSSNNVHVVYHELRSSDNDIFYKKSTDGGTSWTAVKTLTWNTGQSEDVAIATAGSSFVHIAWQDDSPGNDEIFYKRSTDGGVNWDAVKRLTWNSGVSKYAKITAAPNGYVYITYQDNSIGNNEIYVRKSSDGGASWLVVQRMTWSPTDSMYPEITSDSTNIIHFTWTDSKDGGYEIYYKKSTNNGTSWSVITRVTWNSTFSLYPASACDSINKFHLVWMDNYPPIYEIYYKNN